MHEVITVGCNDISRDLSETRDDTVAVAREHGARVITSEPGRGVQLAAGAGAVAGEGLLFLHADTVLEAGWGAVLGQAINQPGADACAFYFRSNPT